MEERIISFNKSGYDASIDFIKGLCILFVVWTHCFPGRLMNYTFFDLWGYPAVPVFLLIQVFHTYKKGLENAKFSLAKIFKRIVLPFAAVMAVILALKLALSSHPALEIIKSGILAGGYGPGSYYPYIYIQFAILLPLFVPVFQKIKSNITLGTLFVAVSIVLDIFCNLIDMPVWLYRLLCLRYVFIIYLGYILVEKGLKINKLTVVLSIISAMTILYARFNGHQFSHLPENLRAILVPIFNHDFTPFLFPAWPQAHWFCYIWDCYLCLFLYISLYAVVNKFDTISNWVKLAGKYSYEIFLFQMFYFCISPKGLEILDAIIPNIVVSRIIYILVSTVVCIVPVIVWKNWAAKRKAVKYGNV